MSNIPCASATVIGVGMYLNSSACFRVTSNSLHLRKLQRLLRKELVARLLRERARNLGDFGVVVDRMRVGIRPVDGAFEDFDKTHQRVALLLERIDVGDVHANGLLREGGDVAAARDDDEPPVRELLQHERRHRPADVDLSGHHLRERAGRAAGGHKLGRRLGLVDELQQNQIGGRTRRGESDRLAVGIGEPLDAALRSRIPERVRGAGRFRADDPHRHALGIGRDHAEYAVGHGDVDAAGYHRRERGRTAFGVKDFNVEPGLLEITLLEPDIDEGAVPEPALGDRDLQSFGAGAVRGGNGGQARQQCKCLPHGILPLNCRR